MTILTSAIPFAVPRPTVSKPSVYIENMYKLRFLSPIAAGKVQTPTFPYTTYNARQYLHSHSRVLLYIAPRSTIINNTMSFSSPSSFSSSVYFSSPPSSSPSTPPPASSYPSSTNKPKVLFIGDLGGHETFDKQIHQIAEVHTLPKVTYDETVELIKQKVEQVGGGFVAFGVSHLNIIYPAQRKGKRRRQELTDVLNLNRAYSLVQTPSRIDGTPPFSPHFYHPASSSSVPGRVMTKSTSHGLLPSEPCTPMHPPLWARERPKGHWY